MGRRAVIVAIILLAWCACASALDPSLDISQYAHKSWTTRDGFFRGALKTMVQTPDGYLWVGTEYGLVRFDGVRTATWQPPAGEHLPSSFIRKLLATRDGILWIGTNRGLVSWKGGKLTHYPQFGGQDVIGLLEDREGTVWAGSYGISKPAMLCAIRSGRTECYGDGRFGDAVSPLYEDNRGSLWVGAFNGLWRWKPGPARQYPIKDNPTSVVETDGGATLVATANGVTKLVADRGETLPFTEAGQHSAVARLLRDRNGGLWIGTIDRGLVHIYQGRTDSFTRSDGLTGDRVNDIFEDREGNVWTITDEGLDRFRELAIPAISIKQGLSSASPGCVLATPDGSVWIGTTDGLNRWSDMRTTIYRAGEAADRWVEPRFQDDRGRIWCSTRRRIVYWENGRLVPVNAVNPGATWTLARDRAGDVWISRQDGLLRLVAESTAKRIPWATLGQRGVAVSLLPDLAKGGLWLGFFGGGVAYFKEGRVLMSYSAADGLGDGRVEQLQLDADGGLWAATEGGLSRIKGGHIATLTSKNGLPCDAVHWMIEDRGHSVWLNMPCGLVRTSRHDLEAWAADPKRTVRTTVFDSFDGFRSFTLGTLYNPQVSGSADGRLWFIAGNGGGVGVIDPRHLPFNKLPPPVHIEQVIADRKVMSSPRLPALTRDLEIEYTALSLVAPEKVRFKYKLEGYDRDWQDAGNRRQAFYTNLPPRKYRFRVIACNNSGVWNEAGDTLEFSIAPAYYQTNWFKAACGAGFLVLLWFGYQLRMRQVQRESRQLRDVIETIPAYVWSALPDGSVDFVNRRWLEFSGFSLDQALGWGWVDALHPEDRARMDGAWRAAIASGDAMEEEARMRSADGQYRWLLFRSVPLRDRSGKIVKWYGKSMDIEAIKHAQQLESDLAHINRVSMMGELAASVAHEVNQPLTGIVSNGSACIRLLAGQSPNVEEALEALRDIVRDGKRAGEVIARIRAMTKRAATPREQLELNDVVREVLVLVKDEAKKRAVSIQTEFAETLGPVMGDRVQLQQVVLNLVMNAMEAMSSVSGRPRELVIHTRNVDDGQVQVTVEDSGVGLDPNAMSKIFEPFYTTKSSGMGMGLSICRSIVQNHSGRLWATANDGPGTRFHFSLPQYHEEEQNARVMGV